MRIAVLGASGRTGQQLVAQALQEGHEVRVLVRRPEAFPEPHPRLTVLVGDARDAARVPMQVLVQTVLHVGLRFGQAQDVDPALARLLGRPGRTLRDYVRDHTSLWSPMATREPMPAQGRTV